MEVAWSRRIPRPVKAPIIRVSLPRSLRAGAMVELGAPEQKLYQNLLNRTFIGFLIAAFLAAFNDQCIHAAAMFFAIRTETLTPGAAISLMPILFFLPWAIFCTLAAYLSDRYSKRNMMIIWK